MQQVNVLAIELPKSTDSSAFQSNIGAGERDKDSNFSEVMAKHQNQNSGKDLLQRGNNNERMTAQKEQESSLENNDDKKVDNSTTSKVTINKTIINKAISVEENNEWITSENNKNSSIEKISDEENTQLKVGETFDNVILAFDIDPKLAHKDKLDIAQELLSFIVASDAVSTQHIEIDENNKNSSGEINQSSEIILNKPILKDVFTTPKPEITKEVNTIDDSIDTSQRTTKKESIDTIIMAQTKTALNTNNRTTTTESSVDSNSLKNINSESISKVSNQQELVVGISDTDGRNSTKLDGIENRDIDNRNKEIAHKQTSVDKLKVSEENIVKGSANQQITMESELLLDVESKLSEKSNFEVKVTSENKNTLLSKDNSQSVIDKSVIDKSIIDKLIIDKSVIDKSVIDKSVIDKSVIDKSIIDKSVIDKSIIDTHIPEKKGVDAVNINSSMIDPSIVEQKIMVQKSTDHKLHSLNERITNSISMSADKSSPDMRQDNKPQDQSQESKEQEKISLEKLMKESMLTGVSDKIDEKITKVFTEQSVNPPLNLKELERNAVNQQSISFSEEQAVQHIMAKANSDSMSVQSAKTAINIHNETIAIYRKDFSVTLKEKVMVMVNQKIKQLEIRLDPPELGSMQVKLNLQNEQAVVNFVVQNQQAKEALEQNMDKLKEMLSQSGVDVGDANIEQRDPQSQEQDELAGQSKHQGSFTNDTENGEMNLSGENLYKASSTGVDYFV